MEKTGMCLVINRGGYTTLHGTPKLHWLSKLHNAQETFFKIKSPHIFTFSEF